MKIYKYTLFGQPGHEALSLADMPIGTKILSCQIQNGAVVIWALVDDNQPAITRQFACYGTGFELPAKSRKHIATIQDGIGFVWHIFEEY